MTNLAEQISRLANPAPVFHDPEDLDDGIVSMNNQFELLTEISCGFACGVSDNEVFQSSCSCFL